MDEGGRPDVACLELTHPADPGCGPTQRHHHSDAGVATPLEPVPRTEYRQAGDLHPVGHEVGIER